MKVAHLISEYLPHIGGAQICIHNISSKFVENNNTIVVITTAQDNILQNFGYKIIRISPWYLRFFRVPSIGKYLLWYKIILLHKKYRFDVWQITMGYPFGAYLIPFFKKKKIPCVLRCSGEDIQIHKELSYGYRISPIVDRIVRNSYPLFDGFIALTESVKAEYNKLGIPDERIRVIPNGVNLNKFSRKKNKDAIKRELGFYGKTVLLTVGRNHSKKGYDLIPQILKIVCQKHNDVVWIIIGAGCDQNTFPSLSHNLRDSLVLINGIKGRSGTSINELPSEKLIEYYHCADLFVFPSYIETFGMVLIEANAAGLPVITSDVPGCRDVIKNGYNGLLSEAGNPEMFAEKILSILNNKTLNNRICNNLSNHVLQYDWGVIASQYREMYTSVISELDC